MKIIDHEFAKVKKKKMNEPLCPRCKAIFKKKATEEANSPIAFIEPPSLTASPYGGLQRN
jgi:hypothetical protein